MTKQEDPRDRPYFWTHYTHKRLTDAGVPLENVVTGHNKSKDEADPALVRFSGASIVYSASRNGLQLEFGVHMELRKLVGAVNDYTGVVEEDFGIADRQGLWIGFAISDNVARVHTIHADDHDKITVPYVEGREYDAREVIDQLLGVFLKGYELGRGQSGDPNDRT